MASSKALRVVAPDETAKAPTKTKTVSTAAADGDRLELLVAVRDRVAKAVEDADTPARDLAALTRRLLEVAKDIEILKAAKDQEENDAGAEDEAFDATAI